MRIQGDRIVLAFNSGTTRTLIPPYKTGSYLYHRGGVLRFGKLTMNDTDLEIVSESQHSPFEFSLPDYNRQLTAGYSKNTPSHGLIVFMGDLRSPSAQRAEPRRPTSDGRHPNSPRRHAIRLPASDDYFAYLHLLY